MTAWTDADGTLHEDCVLAVEILGAPWGEGRIDPGQRPDLHYQRNGLAYFCPECGKIWGRISIADRPWDVVTVACEKHHDPWEVAGSLLSGGFDGLLDCLPPSAVRREFELHLRYGDRNEESQSSDFSWSGGEHLLDEAAG